MESICELSCPESRSNVCEVHRYNSDAECVVAIHMRRARPQRRRKRPARSPFLVPVLMMASSRSCSFAFSPPLKSTKTGVTGRMESSLITDWGQSRWFEFPPRWSPLPIKTSGEKPAVPAVFYQQLELVAPNIDVPTQSRSILAVAEKKGKEYQKATKAILSSFHLPTTFFSIPSSSVVGTFETNTRVPPTNSYSQNFKVPKLPLLASKEAARINDMTGGTIVSLGVLCVLAFDSSSSQPLVDTVTTAAAKIWNAAVPGNTYDVVAIALGETLAGLTGAMATLGLQFLLMSTRKFTSISGRNTNQQERVEQSIERTQGMINQAVAESDYFLARAAVFPILEAVGLPPSIATISSSLVATLPYAMVKQGTQQKMVRQQNEDRLMTQLLEQQQQQEARARRVQQQERWNSNSLEPIILKLFGQEQERENNNNEPPSTHRVVVDLSNLQPVVHNTEVIPPAIDGVEVFADACKWMSYSVLMKEFSGNLAIGGQILTPGVESGLLGLLATLTSQLYADLLYVTAKAGPTEQQDRVKSRAADEWISLYVRKSISAFTLFGVYSSVQTPVKIAVNSFLSGGVDSCIGSSDVDLCMETYYTQNPPSADVAAQLRALATTLYSLFTLPVDSLTMEGPLPEAQLRAVITTLVSLWGRLMS
jgi:hypothetical protein